MKKVLLFFICLILPFSVKAAAYTYPRTDEDLRVSKDIQIDYQIIDEIKRTPSVNAEDKIYDFADLLTDDEEKKLAELFNNFIDIYRMDLALVTINENPYSVLPDYYSNQDYYTMRFADDFYDYNDFGIGDTYDGLDIVVDMSNRYIWISGTGRAKEIFTDSVLNGILDYSYKYFKGGDYYGGIYDTVFLLSEEFDIPLEEQLGINYVSSRDRAKYYSYLAITLVSAIISTVIFAAVNISRCKQAKLATTANNYLHVNGINVINDIMINKHVTSHHISSSSGGGGGGHIGGSGISHSGGGHHF